VRTETIEAESLEVAAQELKEVQLRSFVAPNQPEPRELGNLGNLGASMCDRPPLRLLYVRPLSSGTRTVDSTGLAK